MNRTTLGTVMYDGNDSRQMIHYQRDRQNCRGSVFKERSLTVLDHVYHNGANIVENSQAWLTQEELIKIIPATHMIFVTAWIESAVTDEVHAARMSEAFTRVHANDQRLPGHSLQQLGRGSRTRFYELPGNAELMAGVTKLRMVTPAVPAVPEVPADPDNGVLGVAAVPAVEATYVNVIVLPTPAQRAAADVLDAKMTETQRTQFAGHRPPGRDVLREGYVHLANLPIAAERLDIRRQLELALTIAVGGMEMPTVDLVYWKSMGAIHAKATPSQTNDFLRIKPHFKESMEEWSIRFYQEWDFCKAWVEITPAWLTSHFMAAPAPTTQNGGAEIAANLAELKQHIQQELT